MNTSYEEKTAWITLIAMLAGYGVYSSVAWKMWASGIDVMPAYAGLFVGTVVVLVIFMVVAHIVTAIATRIATGVDERDRLIAQRAEAHSGWIVAIGVMVGVNAMVVEVNDVIVAHILIGSLVLSEVVKTTLQLIAYRRGV